MNSPRTDEGQPYSAEDLERPLEKRRRINPMGEDCYLSGYGWVNRDEDKIIKAQRIWKERAYSPPGGYMYKKTFKNFINNEKQKSKKFS
jgi:hypothetical protein